MLSVYFQTPFKSSDAYRMPVPTVKARLVCIVMTRCWKQHDGALGFGGTV